MSSDTDYGELLSRARIFAQRWNHAMVSRLCDAIDQLRTRLAELEAENKRLGQALSDIVANEHYPNVLDRVKRIDELEAENKRLERLAADALAAWDSNHDEHCGNLLRSMLNRAFCDAYRPDLRREK